MREDRRSLTYLFTANAVSGFAQGISMLAIPWYFNKLHLSGSFNLGYGIITVLVIFWGLYAGTLVDRYNRKNLFLGLNLVCGILFMLIGLGSIYFMLPEGVHHILIIAVFGITMFNYNIHYPALYAMGQELVTPEGYGAFNSRIEIVGQSVSILSGGLAAILLDGIHFHGALMQGFPKQFDWDVDPWSIDVIIIVNAIAHFVAVAFIIPIRYKAHIAHDAGESLKERLVNGWHYLKTHRKVFSFGLASYIVFAMLLVEIHAVLPGYIERHLKEQGAVFAIADAVYAVGALGAGLMVRRVFKNKPVVQSVIILTLTTALFFIWNSMATLVWVTLLMSVVLGFTNAGIRILRLTWLFEHVPNEVMGRVNSIFNMLNLILRFVFILLFSLPLFTQGDHMPLAYALMAVAMILAALILIRNTKNEYK